MNKLFPILLCFLLGCMISFLSIGIFSALVFTKKPAEIPNPICHHTGLLDDPASLDTAQHWSVEIRRAHELCQKGGEYEIYSQTAEVCKKCGALLSIGTRQKLKE